MSKIAEIPTEDVYTNKEYRKILKTYENNAKEKTLEAYPILNLTKNVDRCAYEEYARKIKSSIRRIQDKLKVFLKSGKNPNFTAKSHIILLYMLHTYSNGPHSKYTIMDIYNIIHYYNTSSDDFKSNIKKIHYNQVEKVNDIFNRFMDKFEDAYPNEKLLWNIEVSITHKYSNDNFQVMNGFNLIANSEKRVIYLMIKPQYNTINFNECMIDSLFNSYLIENDNQKHRNDPFKFVNKKVSSCLVTLDKDDVIMLNWDLSDTNEIEDYIKESLKNIFMQYHNTIYFHYVYCKRYKPEDKNSINHTLDKINDQKLHRFPEYIIKFYKDILELSKPDRKLFVEKIQNKEVFIKKLYDNLESSINSFFDIDEDTSY